MVRCAVNVPTSLCLIPCHSLSQTIKLCFGHYIQLTVTADGVKWLLHFNESHWQLLEGKKNALSLLTYLHLRLRLSHDHSDTVQTFC